MEEMETCFFFLLFFKDLEFWKWKNETTCKTPATWTWGYISVIWITGVALSCFYLLVLEGLLKYPCRDLDTHNSDKVYEEYSLHYH